MSNSDKKGEVKVKVKTPSVESVNPEKASAVKPPKK